MKYAIVPLLGLVLLTVGCSPVEQKARDVAAAIKGSLVDADQRFGASCKADPSQAVCGVMKRGEAAQNALITAGEAYCGWDPKNPPADPDAKCVPVKDAKQALLVAIADAERLVGELKGLR